MSFHMIVNSDGCLDYFPNNKPHRFVTHLQTPLNLRENWKVALVDMTLLKKRISICVATFAQEHWLMEYIARC